MRKQLLAAAAISMLMLGACKKTDEAKSEDPMAADTVVVPDESVPEDTATETAAWAGKWIGVEGMYVTITAGEGDKVSLDMQSGLDTKGTYEGTVGADGISFVRGGETLMLKKATGDETGMKWLAGKKDCLIVKTGEGYCKD